MYTRKRSNSSTTRQSQTWTAGLIMITSSISYGRLVLRTRAMIISICLSGALKRHEVRKLICKSGCGDDIAECVNLYIPFLLKWTPNLETLFIIAHNDYQYRPKPDPNGPPGSKIVVPLARVMERAFKPLLQDRLRVLPKLRNLDFRAKEVDRYDWGTAYKDVASPWVEEAAEWFRLRGLQHDAQRKKRQQAEEEAQRLARLERANLEKESDGVHGSAAMTYAKVCEFCKEVGHIQDDCKRWGKFRALPLTRWSRSPLFPRGDDLCSAVILCSA